MPKPMIILLALVAALAVGCLPMDKDTDEESGQAGSLVIRSPQGQILASGTLTLPDPFPASGAFSGTCQLVAMDPQFPAGALSKTGDYRGEFSDGRRVRINLNPGVMDNNLNLVGDIEADQVTGTCQFSTIAGPRPIGTFELRLKSR